MRRNGEQPDPAIPDGITISDLDKSVRSELSSLTKELAADVGAHLAAVAAFIDEDPDRAWRHAIAARRRAARLGIVRETAGLAAYRAGRYSDALSELRTARRLTGSEEHLPVMADSERGLGRPERALELARSAEVKRLDAAGRIEMLIVESGARADLGQDDAAVVTLQVKELDSAARTPAVARLRHAYAAALANVGRVTEAESWFAKAKFADRDGTALADAVNPADLASSDGDPVDYWDYDDEITDLLDDEEQDAAADPEGEAADQELDDVETDMETDVAAEESTDR
ncbi:hypothetical protein ACIB24_20055 [Spongisporangium articulatum]|uniref:Tetratricopeptide repeat-containing protein n=1 Tax=Spongisporangium articulatum TaxID=3362603 RepID=A0ABW8AUQ1_9ACTN